MPQSGRGAGDEATAGAHVIELHLIGYTADLEHIVLDLDGEGGRGRYRVRIDGDLFATLDDVREQRYEAGMDVGWWEPYEEYEAYDDADDADGPDEDGELDEVDHDVDADAVAALEPVEEPEAQEEAVRPLPWERPQVVDLTDDEIDDELFDDELFEEPRTPPRVRVVESPVRPAEDAMPTASSDEPADRPDTDAPGLEERVDDGAADDEVAEAEVAEQDDLDHDMESVDVEPDPRPAPAAHATTPRDARDVAESNGSRSAALPSQQHRRDEDAPRLSPAEIQARLRAGRSVRAVAKDAGTTIAWVERWAAPILAEQARILERAQHMWLERPRLGRSQHDLGRSVARNLRDKGVPDDEIAWEASRRNDGRWKVSVRFTHRSRNRTASWLLDADADELKAASDLARELGFVRAKSDTPKKSVTSKPKKKKGSPKPQATDEPAAEPDDAAASDAAGSDEPSDVAADAPADQPDEHLEEVTTGTRPDGGGAAG